MSAPALSGDVAGFGSDVDALDAAAQVRTAAPEGTTDEKLPQVATVIGLIALAVISLGFKVDVGFVSITIAIVLALVSPAAQKGAVNKISWSTVLLICGMLTFVGVLRGGRHHQVRLRRRGPPRACRCWPPC